MEAYQERVVQEKDELDKKIQSLQFFIEHPNFNVKVSNFHEREDLKAQLRHMKFYSDILQSRINRF